MYQVVQGVVNYISSDEEPLFISEEEEEVEDLSESELEEVIQRNRERSQGTTTVERPVIGVVDVRATHTLSSQCHRAVHNSYCLLKTDVLR